MTADRPAPDVLPPELPDGALSVPPPVPPRKPGFLRRLFTSRRKQQAVAMQNGYLEMVDLIRAIRAHLDRQENVQTSVLAMLEKVPGAQDVGGFVCAKTHAEEHHVVCRRRRGDAAFRRAWGATAAD